MNETHKIWAILRKDDDSNGLLMAYGRVLVASSDEGRKVIADIAKRAWPDDDFIEREFDHQINVDDVVI